MKSGSHHGPKLINGYEGYKYFHKLRIQALKKINWIEL